VPLASFLLLSPDDRGRAGILGWLLAVIGGQRPGKPSSYQFRGINQDKLTEKMVISDRNMQQVVTTDKKMAGFLLLSAGNMRGRPVGCPIDSHG
jgi:hypothetical protein